MESLSRLSGVLETTRSLTLEASSALRRSTPKSTDVVQLQKLLDSKHEREVLDGLRSVISLAQQYPNAPPVLFSAVLKNIASPSLAVKKLVYIYLLQYAESEPDTALLAINTIQKTLSASDPHVRALGLRTMAGIRVPVISQIVSLGIKKGCGDMSPLVRKAAALAIPKCWRLDPSTAPQLTDYLSQLLGDRQYYVVGPAIAAFLEVCPERLDLIHKHYRSLVKKLVDMDEWGQIATLRLLTVYARKCFPVRTKRVKKAQNDTSHTIDVTEKEPLKDMSTAEMAIADPDLTLLLKSAKSLLQSRNSAVIVSVARLYYYCTQTPFGSPNDYLQSAAGPLVSLLRCPPAVRYVALQNILVIASQHSKMFLPYLSHFLPHTTTDDIPIQRSKVEMLTILFPQAPAHGQSLILTELSHFSSMSSSTLIGDAVRAIGRCASSSALGSKTAARCLKLLLAQLSSSNGELVAESLTVIRHLIQADPSAHIQTVTRLAKDLDTTKNATARASIIWLVGEFAGTDDNGRGSIAADVFRILVKGFIDESDHAKAQIVLLGAKCYLHYLNGVLSETDTDSQPQSQTQSQSQTEQLTPGYEEPSRPRASQAAEDVSTHRIPKLWAHLLHLVRYDTSYTLRDLTRVYRALLPPPGPSPWTPDRATTQLASLLLLAPKPVPHMPAPGADRAAFPLGSASLALGEAVAGAKASTALATDVPDWVKPGEEPDPRLRDNDDFPAGGASTSISERFDVQASAASATSAGFEQEKRIGGGVNAGKSLDDWLDESESEDDESEEDEESSEDEEEGETDEESEEDEEEDDESEEDEDEKGRLMAQHA